MMLLCDDDVNEDGELKSPFFFFFFFNDLSKRRCYLGNDTVIFGEKEWSVANRN